MRRRVREILTHPRADDRVGRLLSSLLLLLVAANVVTCVLETDLSIARQAPRFFASFEGASVAVFTVEYMLRLWSCASDPRYADGVRGRLRYALTPMALVDLLAIVPFYVDLAFPGTIDLRFLRILRLLRLIRLGRVRAVGTAVGSLVRVIRSRRIELGVTFAFVLVATLLAAGALYVVEHREPGTQFTSIPRAMWWSIVTITTVGYGDMTPTTPLGQLLGGIVAFIGICALALPVGILSSGFVEELHRSKPTPGASTPPITTTATTTTCPHCNATIDPRP
ncbi:MAG: ion transporter [Myxococcota bacterium]|nr:ion transporter [Myxococcota bacterium]